jgi:hypothetical protein
MSSYDSVARDLAAGVPAEVLCATCPWDRLCVSPPETTAQEIDQKVREAERGDMERDPERRGLPTGMILAALALAGRDRSGEQCPVFALRLRGPDGRQIADGIRGMMRIGYQEQQS